MATIKIPRLNDFTLAFPFIQRKYVGKDVIDTPMDLSLYTDVSIIAEKADKSIQYNESYRIKDNIIYVDFQEDWKIGTYNVIISGKYGDKDLSTLLSKCFEIVEWNEKSNWLDYIVDSPILTETSVFVANTDKEEQIKIVDIWENGETIVLPDNGFTLSKVVIKTLVIPTVEEVLEKVAELREDMPTMGDHTVEGDIVFLTAEETTDEEGNEVYALTGEWDEQTDEEENTIYQLKNQ